MSKKIRWLIVITGVLAVFLTLAIGIPTVMANNSTQPTNPVTQHFKKCRLRQWLKTMISSHRSPLSLIFLPITLHRPLSRPRNLPMAPGPLTILSMPKSRQILNIDKATLEATVQKAANAVLDNKVAATLDQAVAKGTITKDEEAQIEPWFSQRPTALGKLFNIDRLHSFMGWGNKIFSKPANGDHDKTDNHAKMMPVPNTNSPKGSLKKN